MTAEDVMETNVVAIDPDITLEEAEKSTVSTKSPFFSPETKTSQSPNFCPASLGFMFSFEIFFMFSIKFLAT